MEAGLAVDEHEMRLSVATRGVRFTSEVKDSRRSQTSPDKVRAWNRTFLAPRRTVSDVSFPCCSRERQPPPIGVAPYAIWSNSPRARRYPFGDHEEPRRHGYPGPRPSATDSSKLKLYSVRRSHIDDCLRSACALYVVGECLQIMGPQKGQTVILG